MLFFILFSSGLTPVQGMNLERREIELNFNHQMLDDGFGNIRSISISGTITNGSDQDASRIDVLFFLYWETRDTIEKKLKFKNLKSGRQQEFQFDLPHLPLYYDLEPIVEYQGETE